MCRPASKPHEHQGEKKARQPGIDIGYRCRDRHAAVCAVNILVMQGAEKVSRPDFQKNSRNLQAPGCGKGGKPGSGAMTVAVMVGLWGCGAGKVGLLTVAVTVVVDR